MYNIKILCKGCLLLYIHTNKSADSEKMIKLQSQNKLLLHVKTLKLGGK